MGERNVRLIRLSAEFSAVLFPHIEVLPILILHKPGPVLTVPSASYPIPIRDGAMGCLVSNRQFIHPLNSSGRIRQRIEWNGRASFNPSTNEGILPNYP